MQESFYKKLYESKGKIDESYVENIECLRITDADRERLETSIMQEEIG